MAKPCISSWVDCGDDARMEIVYPHGGAEWVMRYGNPESIRYSVASLLASYDYLLSDEITSAEAVRRLRLLRAGRAALSRASATPEGK